MKEVVFTEEELSYLRSIRIYIATPCYGEMNSMYYTRSIARVFSIAATYEIPVTYSSIGNESLITRARNEMVGSFLETNCTHLLFIDADISFDPMDVFKLALHRRAITVASYPTKGLAWERGVGKTDVDDLRTSVINYVINLTPEQTKKAKKNKGTLDVLLYDGLLEIYDAGTGFMLIERAVFDQMVEAYGDDISYTTDSTVLDDSGNLNRKKVKRHAFFDTSIDASTDRYLSEDYTFCRRWQNLGGKIWLDPSIILNHHGTFTYRGYPLLSSDK